MPNINYAWTEERSAEYRVDNENVVTEIWNSVENQRSVMAILAWKATMENPRLRLSHRGTHSGTRFIADSSMPQRGCCIRCEANIAIDDHNRTTQSPYFERFNCDEVFNDFRTIPNWHWDTSPYDVLGRLRAMSDVEIANITSANLTIRLVRLGAVLCIGNDAADPVVLNQISGRTGRYAFSTNVFDFGDRAGETLAAGTRVSRGQRRTRRVRDTGGAIVINDNRFRSGGLRTVGAEIEISAGSYLESIASAIDGGIVGGASCAIPSMSVNHGRTFRPDAADVTTDATCYGEVRGPVVTLDKFGEIYGNIMRSMRAEACEVSMRCGLHIHIGVRGNACMAGAPEMDTESIIMLMNFYDVHGAVFDMFTTPSRRVYSGVNHDWIGRIPSAFTNGTMAAQPRLTRVQDTGHYSAVSTSPLQRRGTIEFRSQAGTLNVKKALGWANLIGQVVDLAVEKRLPSLSNPTPRVLAEAIMADCPNPTSEQGRDATLALLWGRENSVSDIGNLLAA